MRLSIRILLFVLLRHYSVKFKRRKIFVRILICSLFLKKTHSAASKSTSANWIKLELRLAGIDMNLFSPQSTRSASTSAVISRIPIDTILKTAGWTSICTFGKFKKRSVFNHSTFSNRLLSGIGT